VKTYAIDVNTSRIPGEGAQSASWPNWLIIIIIVIYIVLHPSDDLPTIAMVAGTVLHEKCLRQIIILFLSS
jgi:hypothetical protein